MARKPKVYLAAGLFNFADRMRNALLAQELIELGYEVILPQREALAFLSGNTFDLEGVRDDCLDRSSSRRNLVVACLDGTDADSGTVVELVCAALGTSRAIAYRTDFRTEREKEIGLNAMLLLEEVTFIYEPCFAVELPDLEAYCTRLAMKIDDAIKEILRRG